MNNQLVNICKVGQGNACCRYLVASRNGFECAKHSPLSKMLDDRANNKIMTAQADNCEGKVISKLN